ncbi:MAG: hypothetical protein ABF242_07295 [Flavobacteriales bacterium]
MNWKDFIEQNYAQKPNQLIVEFLSKENVSYEEEENIQLNACNGKLKVNIWSNENFTELDDISYVFSDEKINYTRHFEGMK